MIDANGHTIEIGDRCIQVNGVVEAEVIGLDHAYKRVLVETDDEMNSGDHWWFPPDQIEVIEPE